MKIEEWTDLIFNNTNDLIFLVQVEEGELYRCIAVNRAYLQQTGLKHEQVVGKTPHEILPPEAAKYVTEKYKQAIVGREKILYEEHTMLDSGPIIVETTLIPVIGTEGSVTHLFGILRDITERRLQEKVIVQSERAFKDIFNLSPVPMVISSPEGKIMMVNESFRENIGYQTNELIGARTMDLYQDPELRQIIADQLLEKGTVKNLNLTLKRRNGQIAHFLFSSELIELYGQQMFLTCLMDITEWREIESALQKSESNLKTVFENTEAGYILLDVNLNVLSFNHHAAEFTSLEHGRSLETGNNFMDYFPPERHQALGAMLTTVLEGATVSREIESQRANGELRWYFVKYSPVIPNKEKATGILMSLDDITDRKKNEVERNKSFELVSEQNKRLLDFSYIVSHNLRSHTSNIKAILDLISMSETNEERELLIGRLHSVSNALDETLSNLNEVVSIHTDLKTFTEPLNLRAYIEQATFVLSTAIANKKAIILNKVHGDAKVVFNPAYLESILLNFISNAVRYSHPDRDPVVHISYSVDNNMGVLKIEDNGAGIDLKKYGTKLFGMYKTFHGNRDARGVGLFITKNHIEAMGGRVEVESTLGIGTTFLVYIPQKV